MAGAHILPILEPRLRRCSVSKKAKKVSETTDINFNVLSARHEIDNATDRLTSASS